LAIRISPQIPTGGWIVVTLQIIVEPGLGIEVLAGEPQVVDNGFNINLAIAEGIVGRRPNNASVGSGDLLGCALGIVLIPVVTAGYFDKERIGAPSRVRRPTSPKEGRG